MNSTTKKTRDNAEKFPDPTAVEWAAEAILKAADAIRAGDKLSRADYMRLTRATLRCCGREAAK